MRDAAFEGVNTSSSLQNLRAAFAPENRAESPYQARKKLACGVSALYGGTKFEIQAIAV
jgi:hypothetical protein